MHPFVLVFGEAGAALACCAACVPSDPEYRATGPALATGGGGVAAAARGCSAGGLAGDLCSKASHPEDESSDDRHASEASVAGDREELPLERFAGSVQQRLDGRDRDVEMFGDLVVAPASVLAQPEHFAMPGRELGHRLGEVVAIHGGVERVMVGLDGPEIDVGGWLDPSGAPMMVDAQPLGDHRHPGIEAAISGEAGHAPDGLDECLLGQFLGRMGVADAALAVLVQPGVAAPIELLEGRFVAAL